MDLHSSILITKYFAGECTPAEYLQIKSILREFSTKEFDELVSLWVQTGVDAKKVDRLKTELDWIELSNKINIDTAKIPQKLTLGSKLNRYSSPWSPILKTAAVFLVVAVIGLFTYNEVSRESIVEITPVDQEKIQMPNGKRGRITLSDGTKVYLNAGSSIVVPSTFDGATRDIKLEGEAYFEVTKNPNKPFTVAINSAEIEVLGTEFVVRSYDEDNAVRTVVKSGAVSFKSKNEKDNAGLILTAGKLGILDLQTNKMQEETINDLDLYLSWKDGNLKFENSNMDEVARQLERKYDLDIYFADKEISSNRISAEFKSKNLDYILQTISETLGLAYEQEGKKISFTRLNLNC